MKKIILILILVISSNLLLANEKDNIAIISDLKIKKYGAEKIEFEITDEKVSYWNNMEVWEEVEVKDMYLIISFLILKIEV